MGRGYTQYSYPDDDTPDEYAVYSAFLDYILLDGSRLHVNQTDCYCSHCQRIDMAEHIETLEQLQNRIEKLRLPDSDERKMAVFIGSIPDQIVELNRRIEWRRTRQSPAKCLHCGSTEIILLPNDDEFSHPATGARMTVIGRGFMSTAEWHATYTPEGDAIESSE